VVPRTNRVPRMSLKQAGMTCTPYPLEISRSFCPKTDKRPIHTRARVLTPPPQRRGALLSAMPVSSACARITD
jgi:hypothetical protein